MAAYVALLAGFEPQIAGHLLSASIISAPAALVVAKLLVPESETSPTMGNVKLHIENEDANAIDAAARGAIDGLQLALNVGAMLLVFIALVAMFNARTGLGRRIGRRARIVVATGIGLHFGAHRLAFGRAVGKLHQSRQLAGPSKPC